MCMEIWKVVAVLQGFVCEYNGMQQMCMGFEELWDVIVICEYNGDVVDIHGD